MHGLPPLPALAPALLAAADSLGFDWARALVALGVGAAGSAAIGAFVWWRSNRKVREMQTLQERYESLFDRTAVPIVEEDFTEVASWLDRLRTNGVENLQTYIEAHPEEVRANFQKIRVTHANQLGLALLGAEDTEHFGEIMRNGPTPDGFTQELECIWFGKPSFSAETTIRIPNMPLRRGRLHWSVHTRRRGLPDPSRVLLTFTDLTELRASEERYEQLFESLPIPAWLTDAQTLAFLDVNTAAVRHYGWSRSEFLGMRSSDLVPLDEAGSVERPATFSPEAVIVRHRMKDGRVLEAETTSRIVEQPGGKRAVMTVARDVTDKRRADEALRASEERFRSLFEHAAEGVYESVPSGKFRNVNPAFARMFGFGSAAEMMAASSDAVTDLYLVPGRRDEFVAEMSANEVLMGFESEVRKRDGTPFWISENVRAIRDGSGRMLYIQGFVSDITDRKRVERSLRESEARYRTLFEQSPVVIAELDYAKVRERIAELRAGGLTDLSAAAPAIRDRLVSSLLLISLNDAAVRALGGLSKQQIMTHADEILTDEARATAFSTIAAMARGQNWLDGEVPLRRLDGTLRVFYWRWWMPLEAAGPAGGVAQAALLDVTDMRGTEAALRASEQRYRMLFEHSPIGIAEYDYRDTMAWLDRLRANGISDPVPWFEQNPAEVSAAMFRMPMVGANAAMLRLIGATSLEEAARLQTRLFTPEVFLARQAGFLAAWSGKNETEGEITLRSLDGTLRRVYHRWWIPMVDGRPYYERSQLAVLDLTEVKAAERTLAGERERLSVTLRAMTEGVITVSKGGIVEFLNDAACLMTGWTMSTAVQTRIHEVCAMRHERTGVPITPPVKEAVEGDCAIDLPPQTQLVRKDGSTCLVEGRCAPVHDMMGQPVGAVLVFRDVTERSRLESELMRASKLESVGVLAGGIAHDFNNLLAIMVGNLSVAMLDEQVMAKVGKFLTESERGARRARDLTQQLLTFAKGGEPLRAAIRIDEVVQEAAQFATHGANVRCSFDILPDLFSADADKGQIGQVVQNLVINAVQAMPSGGVIKVTLGNDKIAAAHPTLPLGDYVKLSITDGGSGIAPEALPHIFEPYFTTKQQGAGLGLATVYSIVRKHHGHVSVESEIGAGTTFHIWLPAAKERVAPSNPSLSPFEPLRGKILFMDDEEPIRVMAEALMAKLGLEVVSVADGDAAVKAFANARSEGRPFDAVMMDLTVAGGMGGREALCAMLAIDPSVRAVVSSGYSSDPVMANFREHGFKAMVPKPYRVPELSRALREVLVQKA